MNRRDVNILGACETKWVNNWDFVCDKNRKIYAGKEKNVRELGLIFEPDMKKYVLGCCQLFER